MSQYLSYPTIMAQRGEIMRASIGIDYVEYATGVLAFDYERLLADAGLEVVRMAYLFASLLPLMLTIRKTQGLLRPFRKPSGDADLSVPWVPINAALTWIVMREAALARRVRMPFGSSLLIVGKKP